MTRLSTYLELMRLHRLKPISLVLWTTLASVWLASGKTPQLKFVIIFTLGVFVMRTLGCIINDLADKDFDNKVDRTKNRPITAGLISIKSAIFLSLVLAIFAFILVLFLNLFSFIIACIALCITILYPFCKRFFLFPQLVLGLVFNLGIIMAYTSIQNKITPDAWILYIATILWTFSYDTLYALADKKFDIKIGIKSSALTLGNNVFKVVIFCYVLTLVLFVILGLMLKFDLIYCVFLIGIACIFIRTIGVAKKGGIENSIKAFSMNHWVGFIFFMYVVFRYSLGLF